MHLLGNWIMEQALLSQNLSLKYFWRFDENNDYRFRKSSEMGPHFFFLFSESIIQGLGLYSVMATMTRNLVEHQ